MSTEIKTVKERVEDECFELTERLNKLVIFIESDKINSVTEVQRNLLLKQKNAMIEYQQILLERLKTL